MGERDDDVGKRGGGNICAVMQQSQHGINHNPIKNTWGRKEIWATLGGACKFGDGMRAMKKKPDENGLP